MSGKIFLKRSKEKPLLNHHPWIFSGAIARAENARDGDTVDVLDAAGQWLARASYNARSQIVARVWTWERDEQIDKDFFARRIVEAKHLAIRGIAANVSPLRAYRLVNAESDFLPGVVIDCYADFLVAQFLTLGAEKHKDEIVAALRDVGALNSTPLRGVDELPLRGVDELPLRGVD